MIEQLERDLAVTELNNFVEDLLKRDPERARAVYLVLHNLVQRNVVMDPVERLYSETMGRAYGELAVSSAPAVVAPPVLSPEELRARLHQVVTEVVESAVIIPRRVFTTGEVARAFGVSIPAVRKWIQTRRISHAYQAGRNKRVVIPEDAVWRTLDGRTLRVGDVVRNAERRRRSENQVTPAEDLVNARQQLMRFEKHYHGKYEQTLGARHEETLTPDEQRDAAEWRFLLSVLEEDNGGQEQ
ncbi:helix-turn-helix domain-containing protein [Alicyclobacillus kakegawensis]|uniref:helix-turn-helix domain-containing protein n=1 Tax=Alicyclobacillus kakegawensis TaxID=392012 RepID=UPI0012EE19E1|nr:helix-turn-helix domain-containing protein [Alicyclobacillus kakegawensis]